MRTNLDENTKTLFQYYYKKFVIVLMLSVPFMYGGIEFYSRFPRTYTWSELVINYQGGFVRRGLLGEVSYQLNDVIQAKYFLSFVPVILYLMIIWFIVFREKIRFGSLLFLCSPATILFPIYDLNAFARKDVFILAAFVLCIYLSDHVRSQNVVLLLAMIIYGLVGLIVESAWFYLPMAFTVIILNRNDYTVQMQFRTWSISFLYLVGCFIFISLANTPNFSKTLIIDSWRLLYPAYQWDEYGAVSFLGLPLKDGVLLTFSKVFHHATLEGYIYSFILASTPAIWRVLKCKLIMQSKLSTLGIAWAFTVMSCSFAFSTDWGRCIYLFTIHAFLLLTIITNVQDQSDNEANIVARPFSNNALKVLLLFVYATSWKVEHWVVSGQSALEPGFLVVSFRKLILMMNV